MEQSRKWAGGEGLDKHQTTKLDSPPIVLMYVKQKTLCSTLHTHNAFRDDSLVEYLLLTLCSTKGGGGLHEGPDSNQARRWTFVPRPFLD